MWTIAFTCEHCDAPITLSASERGKTARCGRCGERLMVPRADSDSSDEIPCFDHQRDLNLVVSAEPPLSNKQFAVLLSMAGCLLAFVVSGYGWLRSQSAVVMPLAATAVSASAETPLEKGLEEVVDELQEKVDDLSSQLAAMRDALERDHDIFDDESVELTDIELGGNVRTTSFSNAPY